MLLSQISEPSLAAKPKQIPSQTAHLHLILYLWQGWEVGVSFSLSVQQNENKPVVSLLKEKKFP